jgi:hypothetical protein
MLTVAVVSDLHAYDSLPKRAAAPSKLKVGSAEDQPGQHPIAGLKELIEFTPDLRADLLLCPGDMGDKANSVSIQYSWKELNDIRVRLGAKHLIGTAGNHDLDSRLTRSTFDVHDVLKSLQPPFPIGDQAKFDQYWARHFAILNEERYRLVILDSCAFHSGRPAEIDYGRVSEYTLKEMRRELGNIRQAINLLVCHHHPQPLVEANLGEADVMRNGQSLLNALGSGEYGPWMIIHGHKHYPKLSYGSGGNTSCVVLASASFAANLSPDAQSKVRNQFHLISIADPAAHEWGLAGSVRSWQWEFGAGWRAAGPSDTLPWYSGFGFRGSLDALARRIDEMIDGGKRTWNELRSLCPELNFILPQEFIHLATLLEARGVVVLYGEHEPAEFARRL